MGEMEKDQFERAEKGPNSTKCSWQWDSETPVMVQIGSRKATCHELDEIFEGFGTWPDGFILDRP